MPQSQSKRFAVEMYLSISKWQAFSIFFAGEKHGHTLSSPNNTNPTLCTAILIILIFLIFNYFSKNISSASNC